MSNYIDLPAVGDAHWKTPVVLTVSLPLSGNDIGDVRLAEDTSTIYVWTGSSWLAVATPGAAIAIDGLLGDVTATGPGVVAATVAAVGGQTAAAVATSTTLVNTAQSGNKVLASPANGSSGVPGFRVLVNADIPALTVSSINSNTSGVLGTVYLADTSGGAFTLTLPVPVSGMRITIKDKTGSFQTNNLTIAQHASEKIEGLTASKLLQTNWGSWSLFSDGTDWYMGPF